MSDVTASLRINVPSRERCLLRRSTATFASVLLFVALVACEKAKSRAPARESAEPPSPTATVAGESGEWGQPLVNVCALISREEVGAIQEAHIATVLSAGKPDGDFIVSQCVYTAEPESKSVVVTVRLKRPGNPVGGGMQEYWRGIFERGDEREEEGESTENENEFLPPRKIEAVGEDAYWMGGAVYVLQKEAMLRVSVGGAESEETKINRSKSLAIRALSRLFPELRRGVR